MTATCFYYRKIGWLVAFVLAVQSDRAIGAAAATSFSTESSGYFSWHDASAWTAHPSLPSFLPQSPCITDSVSIGRPGINVTLTIENRARAATIQLNFDSTLIFASDSLLEFPSPYHPAPLFCSANTSYPNRPPLFFADTVGHYSYQALFNVSNRMPANHVIANHFASQNGESLQASLDFSQSVPLGVSASDAGWLSFNATLDVLEGKPSSRALLGTTSTYTVRVYDSGGSASAPITSVSFKMKINKRPLTVDASFQSTFILVQGTVLHLVPDTVPSVAGVVTDPDGLPLTYTWSNLDTFNSGFMPLNSNPAQLTGIPLRSGVENFTCTITNGLTAADQTVVLRVTVVVGSAHVSVGASTRIADFVAPVFVDSVQKLPLDLFAFPPGATVAYSLYLVENEKLVDIPSWISFNPNITTPLQVRYFPQLKEGHWSGTLRLTATLLEFAGQQAHVNFNVAVAALEVDQTFTIILACCFASGLLLLLLICSFVYPNADNFALIVCILSVADIATDVLWVLDQYKLSASLQIYALVGAGCIGVVFFLNIVLVVYHASAIIDKYNSFISSNAGVFAFVCVLSILNVENLPLASSGLFYIPGLQLGWDKEVFERFDAHFREKTLRPCGRRLKKIEVVKNGGKDNNIPKKDRFDVVKGEIDISLMQIESELAKRIKTHGLVDVILRNVTLTVIQVYLLYLLRTQSTIAMLSLIASGLSILFGVAHRLVFLCVAKSQKKAQNENTEQHEMEKRSQMPPSYEEAISH